MRSWEFKRFPMNREIMLKVRRNLETVKNENENLNFRDSCESVLWINGFHDFLSAGDTDYTEGQAPDFIFEKSGHNPHYEEPEKFLKIVTDFLES